MPILYIHGVAMRAEDDEGWSTVKPFVQSVTWKVVEEKLRRHLAPMLNPEHPGQVALQQVYWGDLGASPHQPQSASTDDDLPTPSTLAPDELAEYLELRLRRTMPYQSWPDLIEAVWDTTHDMQLRPQWEGLESDKQWEVLQKQAETELRRLWVGKNPLLPWPWHQQFGQGLRVQLVQKMAQLRGTVEGIMPYFIGDIVGYLEARGTPQHPGPIPQRVLAALREMQTIKQQTGEPLVVVTYSMGGQIFYDAMNSFVPAQRDLKDLKVDFWCATGSQLGLFASLNLFMQEGGQASAEETASPAPFSAAQPLSRPAQVAYLWNVWSPSDLLSFQGTPLISGIQDIVVSLTQDALKAHAAYMTDDFFYEALARKVKVVTRYKGG